MELIPNAPNSEGKTPLMVAVIKNDPEIVEILLKAGADREARDLDGKKAKDFGRGFKVNNLLADSPSSVFLVGFFLLSFFVGASI